MFGRTVWTTALAVAALACGAGGCDDDPHRGGHDHGAGHADAAGDAHVDPCAGQAVDAFDPLPVRSGERFSVAVVAADPAIPDKGDNAWVLAVTRDGAAVEGAALTVVPWMPAHGHGTTPERFEAQAAEAAGQYAVGPFNLLMPGFWTVTVTVDDGQGTNEQVVFGVCVEG